METLSIISIYCGGVLSLGMSVFHTRFFKLFKWKKEFEKVTATNKTILYTVHIALLLLFFGITALTLFFAKELSMCAGLSFGLDLFIALFWLWRTVWQIFYFKPDKNSKMLFLHYVLTGYFALLSAAYFIPVILRMLGKI